MSVRRTLDRAIRIVDADSYKLYKVSGMTRTKKPSQQVWYIEAKSEKEARQIGETKSKLDVTSVSLDPDFRNIETKVSQYVRKVNSKNYESLRGEFDKIMKLISINSVGRKNVYKDLKEMLSEAEYKARMKASHGERSEAIIKFLSR